jgi:hypothetical protein
MSNRSVTLWPQRLNSIWYGIVHYCQNVWGHGPLHWQFEQHKTTLEISQLAHCSKWTVYNVLQLHRDYSQTQNSFAHSGSHLHIIDNGYATHALLQANPVLYLDELQEQLFSAPDRNISLATLLCTIWQLAMTHKQSIDCKCEIHPCHSHQTHHLLSMSWDSSSTEQLALQQTLGHC